MQKRSLKRLHLLLDLRGRIPAWAGSPQAITTRRARFFYRMHQSHAFYVARAKRSVRFRVCDTRPADRHSGLRCDQDDRLTGAAAPLYPERLRRVRYHDAVHGHSLVFWTNQFDLPALTIAELYRQRWQAELSSSGSSPTSASGTSSAGPTTPSASSSVRSLLHALVAIAKKRHGLPHSLHQILQVCGVATFERVPLHELFSEGNDSDDQPHSSNRLTLSGI